MSNMPHVLVKSLQKSTVCSSFGAGSFQLPQLPMTVSTSVKGVGVFNWRPDFRNGNPLNKIISVNVTFIFTEKAEVLDQSNIRVYIDDDNIVNSAELTIICDKDTFALVEQAANESNESKIDFNAIGEWSIDESGDSSFIGVKVCSLQFLSAGTTPDTMFDTIQSYTMSEILVDRYCGGSHGGQAFDICDEISLPLAKRVVLANQNDLFDIRTQLNDLFFDLRYTFQNVQNAQIESLKFKEEVAESTPKDQVELHRKYNHFWSRLPATQLFKDGFEWPLQQGQNGFVHSDLDDIVEKGNQWGQTRLI